MRNTNDKESLQSAGLSTVSLMGAYSVCGRIITDDAASFTIIWLVSVAALVLIWSIYSLFPPLKLSPVKSQTTRSVIAAAYLVAAAGLYLNGFINLWQQWSLPNTSRLLLTAAAALVAVYGGCRGIRPVLRLCIPVAFTVLVLFLLDTTLLIPEMTTARFSVAIAGFESSTILKLSAALLLPLPAAIIMLQPKQKGHRSWFLCGGLIGLGYLLLSALRSVMVLGPLTVLEPFPLLRALMLVDMGPGLGRMEVGGLMAISAAMLAAAMAFVAGAFSLLPFLSRKRSAIVAVYIALAMVGIF